VRVYNEKCSLALILEVRNALLNDVLLARDERLLKDDLLFAVHNHHRVHIGNTWHRELTISKRATMAHCDCNGWESLELLGILVGELVMLVVHSVTLDADTKSI